MTHRNNIASARFDVGGGKLQGLFETRGFRGVVKSSHSLFMEMLGTLRVKQ